MNKPDDIPKWVFDQGIEMVTAVLAGDGIKKHSGKWKMRNPHENYCAVVRHAYKHGEIDRDSGLPHTAHAAARALLMLFKEINDGEV